VGYFQPKLRRGRARERKLASLEAARHAPPPAWTTGFDLRRVDRTTYLRFVVRRPDGPLVGLFRGSKLFEADPDLLPSVRARTNKAFRWFNRHLPVPQYLAFGAVCWFRADAEACLRNLRELIEAYRMAGHTVWMVASRSPGHVVYRDEQQVAAVPDVDPMRTASAW
jgi:hypothetical protein